jgi:dUTPase
MADLSRRLLEAFAEVHSGELAPDRAHAMSRIAAVFVQLHSAVEVDARIEALEQAASGRKGYGS